MALRVSPPRIFPEATNASRPPAGSAGSQDAHRQFQFVLEEEGELVLQGLRLESAIAEGASGAKQRNHVVAGGLALWSRSWLSRLQALHAIQWGNYAAALPLLRAATDYQAAQLALLRDQAAEWSAWLEADGLRLAPEQHAMEFVLHPFRSAEAMASHDILGPVYRITTDLALPHFGATLLVAGAESDPSRIAITFGDRDFHLGWAELLLGLLQSLGAAALQTAREFAPVFGIEDADSVHEQELRLSTAAGATTRCRVSIVEVGGEPRLSIAGWRRSPGGAAQRIIL